MSELVSGTYKIAATLFSSEHCSLVLTASDRSPEAATKRPEDRHVEILERALLGCPKKVIACDFVLSQSSIAAAIQRCFYFMGLSCTPSQVPLPVVIAAYAKRARCTGPMSRSLSNSTQSQGERLVQIRRPERYFAGLLPPAEEAIVRLLAEGKSYSEMASIRRTSLRTIANQVASVFRRLGISGRPELLCLLAERALLPDSAPPPPNKAPDSREFWKRFPIASSAGLK